MLVLTREPGETIEIVIPPSTQPRTVTLTVVDIRGDRARLGCEADKDIFVNRGEVAAQIVQAAGGGEGRDPVTQMCDGLQALLQQRRARRLDVA